MVGNSLEQEIIRLYAGDVSTIYSINQIAGRLGKKYPYINKKVTILIKNKIFKKTIAGRSYLCSLNLENEETIYLLILNEIKKKKEALRKTPELQTTLEYIEKINKVLSISLVLKKEEKLFFVLEGEDEKSMFEASVIKQAMPGLLTEAHTKESFLRLLADDKELRENRVILHGYEKYYEYMREIEDELKIRYSRLVP